ncbi:MAG: hypothetical protein R3E79_35925 [Caldilineaceae bacterium]
MPSLPIPFISALFIWRFWRTAAGALLVQLARTAVGRRRSRYTHYALLAGLVTGVLTGVLGALVVADLLVLTNLPLWIFVGMAATTGYKLLR